jgi:hypothetical protein
MRDSETRPSHASSHPAAAAQGVAPGLVPAVGTALLSGIACWLWLASSTDGVTMPPEGPGVVSELARVADQDISAALATMNGSNAFLGQYKARADGCTSPLAWITIARAPGQPPGNIRLMSGTYYTPIFELTETPVRVAIPYPAAYEAGQGMLSALDAGPGAVVALTPAWHVPSQAGAATREVSWHVTTRCKTPHG